MASVAAALASDSRAVPTRELSRVRRSWSNFSHCWRATLALTASEHGVYVLYAGLTGFEGGKGMSGSSCVVDPRGEVVVAAPAIGAHIVRADLQPREVDLARAELPLLGDLLAVLPDLLLDDELPLPVPVRVARDHKSESGT